ncbi:MAG: gluconokinase [Aquificota bacterium]|nr:gluconokinase [Aquificaceae bacterium]QWK12602.1 MAG: gluconokinase [Aquificota bacterium]HAV40591.1 gluconokinase [Aquificaceae bacterium]
MIEELSKELGAKVIQTHTSWVLLLEDIVYKIKKPVNFGFLDYSTLEKRLENCKKEVELNKRLCQWVYIGVVPISFIGNRYVIEDSSNPVEYAVKMRRIPEERLLKNMLSEISKDDMKRLARHIANFHLKAERRDEFGRLEVMKFNTDENFMQTEKYIGITIEKEDYEYIKEKTNRFYEKYQGLFEKRIREGRIRDGHGDIRLEHVAFLQEGICVFDCIEFNDRFRCGDMLNDMCFLSMELDLMEREDLSKVYEEEYQKITEDEEFDLFLPFFKCYRAYVRGKVNSFLLDDPHYTQKEEAKVLAQRLFKLSKRYAEGIP